MRGVSMTEIGASAGKTVGIFRTLGFTHILMIPDSESRCLFEAVSSLFYSRQFCRQLFLFLKIS
jgi:hypothetical protein